MTFEDFFIKKKIDLQQLQRAEPLLFEEFKSHYELMGEKSFDHTKKYWFNRLRKSFHLAEVIASVAQPAVTTVSSQQKNDSLSAETTSPAVKPMGFKPRFKAVKPQPTSESTTENIPKAGAETPVQKPIGFKPRFKPGQVGKAPDETKDNTTPVDQPVAKEERAPSDSQKVEASPTNKPTGFKPRFKAGVTTKSAKPVTEKTPVSDSQNTAEPTAKKEAASQISEQTKQAKAEPANEDRSGENTPPVSKPTGFKPRFKPKSKSNESDKDT